MLCIDKSSGEHNDKNDNAVCSLVEIPRIEIKLFFKNLNCT